MLIDCTLAIESGAKLIPPSLLVIDNDGWTPLHVATFWGHVCVIYFTLICVKFDTFIYILLINNSYFFKINLRNFYYLSLNMQK